MGTALDRILKGGPKDKKKRKPEPTEGVPKYTDFGKKPQPQSFLPSKGIPGSVSRSRKRPSTAVSEAPTEVPTYTDFGTQQSMAPEPTKQPMSVVNDDGSMTTYADYNPDKSYISQIGEYQYDFWSKEGQKERVARKMRN